MALSKDFPFKLPRLIHVDLDGKDCMAVENHYNVYDFGDEAVIHHLYDKKKYIGLDVIEEILRSPQTSDSEKVLSALALIREYDVFERKMMELFERAEEYNSRSKSS
jgi:hypothetical protein